jgi:nucleotide-binding universal stress UspA family protein
MSDGCQFFKFKEIARKRCQPADAKRARVLNLRRTNNMKVLIGYDGSESAEKALDELNRAGLPVDTEILVVAVGSIWMPPTDIGNFPAEVLASRRVAATMAQLQTQAAQALKHAEEISNKAAAQIKSDFPDWRVQTECMSGDAASALIKRASDWQSDLIIVGSQNRSAVGRLFLGSVSKKVVAEAGCSVRVARSLINADNLAPQRIIAGIDNSDSANSIIEAIAERNWTTGGEVLLLTAIGAAAEYSTPVSEQLVTLDNKQQAALERLAESGLKASLSLKLGEAKRELLLEAEKWKADCIFVGTRNIQGVLDRFLLGSVSSGVVSDAPCSVEVVRATAN